MPPDYTTSGYLEVCPHLRRAVRLDPLENGRFAVAVRKRRADTWRPLCLAKFARGRLRARALRRAERLFIAWMLRGERPRGRARRARADARAARAQEHADMMHDLRMEAANARRARLDADV